MFTGIVEAVGTVKALRKGAHSAIITVEAPQILDDVHLGDSIAVNGVCLTVTAFTAHTFDADIMHETLDRSDLGALHAGSKVNVERAMAANGRFGGHIVSGHIDGVGKITRINTPLIEDLVADDYIPIIASIAIGEDGGCYNVNADVAAGYIAAAIGAHKIIFLTDVDGLYENYPDPDSLIAEMSLGEAEAMVRGDKLASGMIPKLASCVRALDSGVSAAHIINGTVPHALLLEMLTDSGMGTMVGGLASAQFLNVSPVSKFAAKLIENR